METGEVGLWLDSEVQPPEFEVCFTPNNGHSEAHAGLPGLTQPGHSASMDFSSTRT